MPNLKCSDDPFWPDSDTRPNVPNLPEAVVCHSNWPCGHFPSDEAATKLIWLALRNVMKNWSRGAREWIAAMNQFALMYPDRFTRQGD